ncbi:Permease and ATP-binding protein of an ABC transporter complex [Leptospira biflexa serovar Patoc strain 'Patoc 1 (Ames)']|uniref:ABC-type transport system, ATP binding protein putative membrane protein putative signal peptide n=1 Tax=Leptospira biflexa serovar Patoc (strain Patoc 1 / ATCC 23582 / Paris) TaxID=456481 RepID=B0SRZ6_LEPBP|nr:ABC transporter transmembrane domain-containing protein [Leptospira biflexa]ABZ95820.1 Permease and ATP-binding protein of an ABC transporter complex [Leptospira biflexa serovar Patoc strain 'Patoc 1 (Ames)']ABZ99531.1 ABC-type transport system, ATP binding protein; putative membrane protein; putative signal peptide [Leptospira biflexa serovar Patoc strain 'Patoc 1 (Paris)']
MQTPDRPKSKNLRVLSKTFSYLKPYRLQMVLSSFALLFTAGVTLGLGQGLRHLVDAGFSAKSKQELGYALVFIIFVGILLAIGTYIRHYTVSWIGERVASDIRKDVFQHIIFIHPSFFESNSPGEIQSRITTDTTLIQTVIGSSASIALRNILMFVGGIIFLFITNAKLTLIVLLSVPFIVFPILFYGKKVRNLSRNTQDKIASIGTYVSESLLNIKILQSFHHQKVDIQKFSETVEDAFAVAVARIRQRALLIGTVILFILTGISFMLWVGGTDVLEGKITGGELIAFSFYAIMVANSVGAVSEVLGDLQRAAGATERLMELLLSESEIKDPEFPKPITEIFQSIDTLHNNNGFGKQNGLTIHLNQLAFSYPSRPEHKAIKGINLEIPANKTTALVGPSGGGKSTLFELILRFYDPTSGTISISGINTKELKLEDLRSLIGFVPQQPILFSGTLRENIAYGKPNASFEEIQRAAESAYVTEFLNQLPEGYDTNLGHLGTRLSGGQKQRIAIARAILRNPRILLLDEATSALDSESEQMIQRALDHLVKERTTIMIAHRLSTVVKSNQIVVIREGEIESVGTHDELLKQSELYERLAKLQFHTELL